MRWVWLECETMLVFYLPSEVMLTSRDICALDLWQERKQTPAVRGGEWQEQSSLVSRCPPPTQTIRLTGVGVL